MTRKSDSDGWYDPEMVPSEMETTAEERGRWLLSLDFDAAPSGRISKRWARELLRDLDRALAEIARLTAINADLCTVNLRHAEESARIAELEAERDRLLIDHAINLMSWQAERDRLKAALGEIANSGARQHDFAIPADHVTWTIHRARAALSGEGVTK